MNHSFDEDKKKQIELLVAKAKALRTVLFLIVFVFFMVLFAPKKLSNWVSKNKTVEQTKQLGLTEDIKDGIHIPSGLVAKEGFESVLSNCGNCHSMKLVTQNRATKEGWSSIIKWMQQTQNLWDLGANEEIILNYLAKNYAPEKKGRRENLKDISWYELEK